MINGTKKIKSCRFPELFITRFHSNRDLFASSFLSVDEKRPVGFGDGTALLETAGSLRPGALKAMGTQGTGRHPNFLLFHSDDFIQANK